jgi:hypothetical protein
LLELLRIGAESSIEKLGGLRGATTVAFG